MIRTRWPSAVVLVGLMMISAAGHAQQWAWTYGGINDDSACAAEELAGGGYIVGGTTRSIDPGNNDIWLLKLDAAGLVVWEKTYGGTESDEAAHMEVIGSGGYIVAGTTHSFGTGGDIWVMMINSNGSVSSLAQSYGGTESDRAAHIQQTSDNGYVVAGTTESFGATNGDIWVLKLTSSGSITWQNRYGGTEENSAAHMQQTQDGGYIVAGRIGTANGDCWVLKLNSDGSIGWQKSYGTETFVPPDQTNDNTEACHHVEQTADEGYIVSGRLTPAIAGNTRAWVLKLEPDGDVTWEKSYWILGDVSETWIQETTGGYMMTGGSSVDAWAVKLDGSGNVLWGKRYGGATAGSVDHFRSIQETSDSGILVAGQIESFGVGQRDAWVLKLDGNGEVGNCPAMGDLTPGAEETTAVVTDTEAPATGTGISEVAATPTVTDSSSARRNGCNLIRAVDTRVRLPKTGQTACYDSNGEIACAGTGQDGDLQTGVSWPSLRFTDHGDGTVTDNLTGLMWLKDGNCANTIGHDPQAQGTGAMTWASGLDFAAGINDGAYDISACSSYTATHTDWRVPNVNEMESLANLGAVNPATWLNGQGFTNAQAGRYWSSTTQAGPFPAYKWTVNLEEGGWRPVYAFAQAGYQYVWPVRAGQRDISDSSYPANIWKTGQTYTRAPNDDGDLEMGVAWPANRFTDHGDGTVTDNLTGLMWLKDANCANTINYGPGQPLGAMWWYSALAFAAGINDGSIDISDCASYTATYRDWRVPNRKELFSLIDHSRYYNCAVQEGHPFVHLESQHHGYWWTSTTVAGDPVQAYRIHLSGTSLMEAANKTVNPVYVWPVRGDSALLRSHRCMPWVPLLLLEEE